VAAKNKPAGATRTAREFSAGGVIWRRTNDEPIEVILVRPAGRAAWALPKGQLERGESAEAAAIRECAEETGLTVRVTSKLGDINYVYSRREPPNGSLVRIFKKVSFFLMELISGEPHPQESEIDEVRWVDIDEALRMASYKSEHELIEKARSVLTERQPKN